MMVLKYIILNFVATYDKNSIIILGKKIYKIAKQKMIKKNPKKLKQRGTNLGRV